MSTQAKTVKASYNIAGFGNTTIAHTLGKVPIGVEVVERNGVSIWLQATLYDANNIYVVTSDSNAIGDLIVWG